MGKKWGGSNRHCCWKGFRHELQLLIGPCSCHSLAGRGVPLVHCRLLGCRVALLTDLCFPLPQAHGARAVLQLYPENAQQVRPG